MVKILREMATERLPRRKNKVEIKSTILNRLGLAADYAGKDRLILNTDNREKTNCELRDYYLFLRGSDTQKKKEMNRRLRAIGAKYVTFDFANCYFYLDLNKIEEEVNATNATNEETYQRELSRILDPVDIEQYRPSEKIMNKLMAYRDKGSRVNVKSIKGEQKAMTYYYAGKLMGWDDLCGDIRDVWKGDYFDEESWEGEMKKMDLNVQVDPQYAETRSEDEVALGLGNLGNMFTFDTRKANGKPSCWLPRKVFDLLRDNNAPAHFLKRTSGGMYDHHGAQWSEVEHLVVFPGTEKEFNFDIVVHTSEGGGSNRYSCRGTRERASLDEVLQMLQDRIDWANSH